MPRARLDAVCVEQSSAAARDGAEGAAPASACERGTALPRRPSAPRRETSSRGEEMRAELGNEVRTKEGLSPSVTK